MPPNKVDETSPCAGHRPARERSQTARPRGNPHAAGRLFAATTAATAAFAASVPSGAGGLSIPSGHSVGVPSRRRGCPHVLACIVNNNLLGKALGCRP